MMIYLAAFANMLIGFALGYFVRGHYRRTKQTAHFTTTPGQDEYLRWNGQEMVPMWPREYVHDGAHPVAAARARTRAEGVRYETRRTE